jgi:hypothetical protein
MMAEMVGNPLKKTLMQREQDVHLLEDLEVNFWMNELQRVEQY